MSSASTSQVQEEVLVLFHAACIGRTDIIQNAIKLIKKDNIKENEVIFIISSQREEDGATPLHLASFYNHSDVVRALLNAEADPTIRGFKGDYANKLPYEVSSDRIKKTYELFFFEQIALSNIKMIKKLLLSGISIETMDENEDTALHWAVNFNSLESVEELIKLGGDIDKQNKQGETPLHIAFKNANYNIIYLLLSEDAQLDIKNFNEQLPIDLLPNKVEGEIKEKILRLLSNPPEKLKKNKLIYENNKLDQIKKEEEMKISEEFNNQKLIEDHENDFYIERFFNEIDEDNLIFTPLASLIISSPSDQPCNPIQLPLYFWPPVKHQCFTYASLDTPYNYLSFSCSNTIFISLPNNKSDMSPMLKWSGLARSLTERGFQITTKKVQPESSHISIVIDPNIISQLVSYKIEVNANKIFIVSGDFAGILYGLETFKQLIEYHSIFQENEGKSNELLIPFITITDSPDIINRSILWSFRSYIQWNWNIFKEMVSSFFLSRINQIYLILDGINDDNKWNIPSKIVYDRSLGNNNSEVNDKKNLLLFEQYCAAHLIEIIPTFFLTSIHTQLPVLVLKDMQHSMISINLFHDIDSLRLELGVDSKFHEEEEINGEIEELESNSIQPSENIPSPTSFTDLFGLFSIRSQSSQNNSESIQGSTKRNSKKSNKIEKSNNSDILTDEIIIETYKTYCTKLFQNISQCDFTTIQLSCSPWVLKHINPQILAQNYGLNLNFISNSQFLPNTLISKSILGAKNYIDKIDTYISKIYEGISYKNINTNCETISKMTSNIQSKNMACLPLYNELDFNLPSILLKFYINIFGSLAWNIKGTKELIQLASKVSSDMFSDSPLFIILRNYLFPDWNQLTLKKNSFNSLKAIEEIIKLFLCPNTGAPSNDINIENLLDIERKLIILANNNNNLYSKNSFYLPSRSSLSYCSKIYKKLLIDCNWNIRERLNGLGNYAILTQADQTSNTTPAESPRSFMEYMGFFSSSSSSITSNSFQSSLILFELDEFLSFIHSLNTLSKLSLQCYNCYIRNKQEALLIKNGVKNQKDISSLDIPLEGLTFPYLCSYLSTGSRSDAANSLLESVSFLISLFRYKFSSSLLKLFMNSHNLLNTKNEFIDIKDDSILNNPNLNTVSLKKLIDIYEKKNISIQFINQKLPLVPLSCVFRFICQELDVPRSLYEYIETIFR